MTRRLLEGARRALIQQGISRSKIRVVWVPGAFELPLAAAAAANDLHPRAIVALGCVVRGQTPQYAALGQAVTSGLAQVSVTWRVPVGCGVIIADSVAQAHARAGGTMGNRGREAALAAVEMMRVTRQLQRRRA